MLDFRARTFLEVCKTLNYTRAAEALHMTQPGVSQHIRYLEGYYRCKLFVYRGRKLCLTEEGATLRRAFLTMAHDVDTLRSRLGARGELARPLRFGATRSIGEYLLPRRLAAFGSAHPNLQMTFTVANTQQLLGQLEDGAIEFAFVEGNVPRDRYACRVFREEPFTGVCGATYPLGELGEMGALCRHPLILREDGSGTKDIFEQLLREHGYGPEQFPRVWTVNSPHVIKTLLEANLGISFLYRIVAEKELQSGRLRQFALPGLQLTHPFQILWSQGSLFAGEYDVMTRQLTGEQEIPGEKGDESFL